MNTCWVSGSRSAKAAGLVLAALSLVAQTSIQATVVSFGFSGTIQNADSYLLPLPAGIAKGIPFNGIMSYDTAAAKQASENPPKPDYSAFYFDTGFSLCANVAGHFFSTVPVAPKTSSFNIIIWDGYDDNDQFSTDNSLDNFRIDNSTFPDGYRGGFYLYLSDPSTNALASDILPTVLPPLDAWTNLRRFGVVVFTPDRTKTVWSFLGVITELDFAPRPTLSIRRKDSGEVVLAWPILVDGFTLESASGPDANDWEPVLSPVVDLETEHTVTVAAPDGTRVFRLNHG